MKAFILIAAAIVLASSSLTAQAPVSVFVTSVGAVNGFTDPNKDNADTVRDLREAIQDRKGLVLSDVREQAAILLVVTRREAKAQGLEGLFGAARRDYAIYVNFLFKDMETPLSASVQAGLGSAGAWGKAAENVAKQVEQWVKANRAKL